MTEKIKKIGFVVGLGVSMAFLLLQFELIAWHQATEIVTGWFYKQMVVSVVPVTPNLAIRQEKAQVADIVSKIYVLESSGGKFDACKREGKGVNGYGFKPGTCYKNHEEVQRLVTNWVTSMLHQGYSTSQIACYYNLGKVNGQIINNCKYYENYQKI